MGENTFESEMPSTKRETAEEMPSKRLNNVQHYPSNHPSPRPHNSVPSDAQHIRRGMSVESRLLKEINRRLLNELFQ